MKTMFFVGGFLIAILFIGLWFMGNYNSLVTARNQVDKSWSMVETQYQRRLDLIDNLVQSVKGQQNQEQKVFIDIANARNAYAGAKTDGEKMEAMENITSLSIVPRLQEAYPELKSSEHMTKLMNELAGTENGINQARDTYNTTANNYNTNIQRFPKNLFAGMFGFTKKELFKAVSGAENATKVQF